MSKNNDQTKAEPQKQANPEKKRFEAKPVLSSCMYFSKDGKYLIHEKTEKFIYPASYYMKVIDGEIARSKGEPQ